MSKEKHQPKGNKGRNILSGDAEMTLYGLMIFLVALIGFLNRGVIGNFLTFIFVYIFGVFYFVFFLFAIFFGLYMVFKKKIFKISINLQLLGCFLILIAAMIGASLASENLTIANMFSRFQNQLELATASGSFYQIEIANVGLTGGGIVGFFLAALLNVTISNIGGLILVGILFVVGLYLLLASPLNKIIKAYKNRKKKNKEIEKVDVSEEKEDVPEQIQEEEEIEDTPVTLYKNPAITRAPLNAPFVSANRSEQIIANDIDEDEEDETLPPIEETYVEEVEQVEITDIKEEVVQKEPIEPIKPSKTISNPFASKPTSTKASKAKQYKHPPLDLLELYPNDNNLEANEEISITRQDIINKTFEDFGIGATSISFKIGPSVTRFDVTVKTDVSVKNIEKVIDDISVRLGGIYARFTRVVPGKTTSGLEIPNKYISLVPLREVLKTLESNDKKLLVPFGKDISGEVIAESMVKFPHMLVAGTTGTGKSVFIHSLITSILMRHSPDEVRFLMIDPKRVEFSLYKEMPHLLCPIINDALEAKMALKKLTMEMENRFTMLEQVQVNDIRRYNEEMELIGEKKMPYIIVVIDEYADIIEECRDIEAPLIRLAQKARAAGIHLVIATQRPSTKVVTGVLKANLPTKVALKVALPVDSVTILGQGGAETLLGRGDSLVDCTSISRGDTLVRIQGSFVDDREIKRVVEYLKKNYEIDYDDNFLDLKDRSAAGPAYLGGNSNENDEAYDEVKQFVMNREFVSISRIQNTFNFGYPRASKIFSMLQNEGIVEKTIEGSTNSKGAKVLVRNVNNDDGEEEYED